MSYWRIKSWVFTALLAAWVCVSVSVFAFPAAAQETMTETEALDFGLFSLHDNDAQYTMSVDASDNSWAADPAFAVSTQPQRGEYLLEGFTPGTEIFVNVADGGLTLNGGGGTEVFATIDYSVWPTTIIADGAGEAVVYIGGTLRTLGNSTMYASGPYSDNINVTFTW